MLAALPVIDLRAARHGEPGALQRLAEQLDEVCRAHGFFIITGHGVEPSVRAAAFDRARTFFCLSEADKARWHIQHSPIKRGFDPVGWQRLDPTQPPDLKESFYLGVDRGPQDPLVRAGVPQQGPNQWPDEALVPGFRAATTAYEAAVRQLGHRIMGYLALALGLERQHFEPFMRDPMPVLRLLHYPSRPASLADLQPGTVGCGAHTDWGGITLLAQDEAGGLQVWLGEPGQHNKPQPHGVDNQHGADAPGWVDVPYVPDSFVVNLGDMMARWTNDRWRSTLHRVLPQPPGRERWSIAYFFDIDYHAQVSALPGCFSAEHPARYAPVTAGQHIAEMYERTTVRPAESVSSHETVRPTESVSGHETVRPATAPHAGPSVLPATTAF
jgi:isopenicillin N synthase-like dioxygenase